MPSLKDPRSLLVIKPSSLGDIDDLEQLMGPHDIPPMATAEIAIALNVVDLATAWNEVVSEWVDQIFEAQLK